MKLKQIHANVWIGGILILFSVIFFLMSGKFSNPSAAIWPKAILIGIMILSSLLLLQGVKMTGQQKEAGTIPASALKGSMTSLVCIIIYAILMNYTGYFVSTAIFLPFGMYALGQRNWKAILGVTVGLEVFVYILFVTQLQLRMP